MADDSGHEHPESLSLSEEEFEKLVVDELDALPDDMVEGLDNVVFVTEARPEDGSLDLLGLYEGVALTDRGQYGFGELPDRIILYREPLIALAAGDLDELREQIHVTLVHEIAHFYGIDDEELHRLGWG
ncbi:MAG: metallopeptidase family protein [Microcella sp.]